MEPDAFRNRKLDRTDVLDTFTPCITTTTRFEVSHPLHCSGTQEWSELHGASASNVHDVGNISLCHNFHQTWPLLLLRAANLPRSPCPRSGHLRWPARTAHRRPRFGRRLTSQLTGRCRLLPLSKMSGRHLWRLNGAIAPPFATITISRPKPLPESIQTRA